MSVLAPRVTYCVAAFCSSKKGTLIVARRHKLRIALLHVVDRVQVFSFTHSPENKTCAHVSTPTQIIHCMLPIDRSTFLAHSRANKRTWTCWLSVAHPPEGQRPSSHTNPYHPLHDAHIMYVMSRAFTETTKHHGRNFPRQRISYAARALLQHHVFVLARGMVCCSLSQEMPCHAMLHSRIITATAACSKNARRDGINRSACPPYMSGVVAFTYPCRNWLRV